MRTSLFAATLLGLMLAPAKPARAEEGDVLNVPANSKFLVHIDIGVFRETHIGGKLFEMAKHEAMKEITERHGDEDGDDDFKKLKEALGFDPFTELDAITVVGSDFKHPEDHVHLILRMKQTTGNLEGLMTSLPGYSSTEYGDHVIHTAEPDRNERVFGAIHTDQRGTKRVVAARSAKEVKALLDMLDGKSRAESKAVKLSRAEGQFVHIELLELPQEEIGKGPQANVARMIQGLSINVGDDGEDVSMSVTLRTRKNQQAKQIKQMVQGLTAMIQLIQDENQDEELERAKEFLERIEVERDGNMVRIRLVVPEDELVELIEDEMEINLNLKL